MKVIRVSGIRKSFAENGLTTWTVAYDICGTVESLKMADGNWEAREGEISFARLSVTIPSLQINQLYVVEPVKGCYPIQEYLRKLTFFEKRRLPAVAKKLLANTL